MEKLQKKIKSLQALMIQKVQKKFVRLQHCTIRRSMKVNGLEITEKDKVRKLGLMDKFMLESGRRIEVMGKEDLRMQMEIFMKAVGSSARLWGMVSLFMLMASVIKDTGLMTNNMVLVLKHGQMEQVMKVSIKKEKNTGKDHSNGLMAENMKAHL